MSVSDGVIVINKWKEITKAGNKAFRQGRDNTAKQLYLFACHRAVKLFPHWFDGDAATAALVISYQNLADLYLRQSNHSDMLVVYKELLKQLQDFDNSDRFNIDSTYRRIGTEITAKLKDVNFKSTESVELFNVLLNEYFNPTNHLIRDQN
jgi:hypothetical protein